MENPLDPLLARLTQTPVEHRLEGFERGVWARLEQASRWSPASSLRVRLAAVGVALLAGAAVGSVSATASAKTEPVEMAVFSDHPRIAPSTLLDATS